MAERKDLGDRAIGFVDKLSDEPSRSSEEGVVALIDNLKVVYPDIVPTGETLAGISRLPAPEVQNRPIPNTYENRISRRMLGSVIFSSDKNTGDQIIVQRDLDNRFVYHIDNPFINNRLRDIAAKAGKETEFDSLYKNFVNTNVAAWLEFPKKYGGLSMYMHGYGLSEILSNKIRTVVAETREKFATEPMIISGELPVDTVAMTFATDAAKKFVSSLDLETLEKYGKLCDEKWGAATGYANPVDRRQYLELEFMRHDSAVDGVAIEAAVAGARAYELRESKKTQQMPIQGGIHRSEKFDKFIAQKLLPPEEYKVFLAREARKDDFEFVRVERRP